MTWSYFMILLRENEPIAIAVLKLGIGILLVTNWTCVFTVISKNCFHMHNQMLASCLIQCYPKSGPRTIYGPWDFPNWSAKRKIEKNFCLIATKCVTKYPRFVSIVSQLILITKVFKALLCSFMIKMFKFKNLYLL